MLLDYTMPVMDGFEVLARLRSDPDLKATPVIMLTAEAGRETVIKIAKLGVRDYLIKPFKGGAGQAGRPRVKVTLKAKAALERKNKRYDDPISILVVDDKPAIAEQIPLPALANRHAVESGQRRSARESVGLLHGESGGYRLRQPDAAE